ncbi:MAG: type IV pilus assembly protein PilM [Armatimonadota bacterium]
MAARRSVKLKDHNVLALDIGTRFIKVVELRLARGVISLLNVAVCPTPPDMRDNSQIIDPVGLGRTIRQLLAMNKIKTSKVVLAISGQSSVVVRPIDLPKMTRKELADTMKFEVERHIPFTVDEVVMDYAPFADAEDLPEEESNMKVLLAVAQEELINAYIKMLRAAGLDPIAMDVEILATIRSLVDVQEQNGSYEHTLALINIGASSTDISIIDRGNVTFTRSVPIAGDALTEAIADQLGRNFEEAEELKKQFGWVFLDSAFEVPTQAYGEDNTPPVIPGMEAPPQPISFFDSFDTVDAGAEAAPSDSASSVQSVFSLDEDFAQPGPLTLGGGLHETDQQGAVSPFALDDDVDDEVYTPYTIGAGDAGGTEAPIFRLGGDDEVSKPASPVFDLDDEVDDEVSTPFVLGTDAGSAEAPMFRIDQVDTTPPAAPPSPVVEEAPIFRLDEPETAAPAPSPIFDIDAAVDDELSAPVVLDDSHFGGNSALSPLGESGPVAPFTPEPAVPAAPAASTVGPVFDLSSELEEQMPPPLSRPAASSEVSEPEAAASRGFMESPLTPPTTSGGGGFMSSPLAPPAPSGGGGFMESPLAPPTANDGYLESTLAPPGTPQAPMERDFAFQEFDANAAPAEPSGEQTFAATPFVPSNMLDEAPVLERPDLPQGDVFPRRIFEAMLPVLVELVTEIRRSLEYYSSRETDTPIERIVIYGGTSRLPNIAEFIRQELGIGVENADPLQPLDLSRLRQPVQYVEELSPALPICIGLGLRDMIA